MTGQTRLPGPRYAPDCRCSSEINHRPLIRTFAATNSLGNAANHYLCRPINPSLNSPYSINLKHILKWPLKIRFGPWNINIRVWSCFYFKYFWKFSLKAVIPNLCAAAQQCVWRFELVWKPNKLEIIFLSLSLWQWQAKNVYIFPLGGSKWLY